MSFAKHESFHIRDGWLRKGMEALQRDPGIFLNPEAPTILGLGKNMVRALRFWMVATGLAEEFRQGRRTLQQLTPFGRIVYEHDRYLEEEATLWLVHYHLASNPRAASTWYWFFNHFDRATFSKAEFVEALAMWARENADRTGARRPQVARRSLERDFECLVRTYLPGGRDRSPEETIECPLANLELLQVETGGRDPTYRLLQPDVERMDPLVVLYAMKDWLDRAGRGDQPELNFAEALREPRGVGRVFNLGASSLSALLVRLQELYPQFRVRRQHTAGLDLLELPLVAKEAVLRHYYEARKVYLVW
ncbi:MAG: DUF4007 family protein [Ardenticatenia bacterium]|nr:DUF4007 family protein [Ardenticatenia bacterium]